MKTIGILWIFAGLSFTVIFLWSQLKDNLIYSKLYFIVTVIGSVGMADEGTYRCTATTSLDEIYKTGKLS